MNDNELLALVKQHLNINADYTDEDDYLEQLIATAKEAVSWQIDRVENEETNTDIQALLLLVGELYLNREVTGEHDKSLPKGYDYLIGTKRRYTIA